VKTKGSFYKNQNRNLDSSLALFSSHLASLVFFIRDKEWIARESEVRLDCSLAIRTSLEGDLWCDDKSELLQELK
jgi:hypothetical protein